MPREIHKSTWGMPLYDAIQLRSPGVDADTFWQAMPAVHEEFIKAGQVDIVPEANLKTLDTLAKLGKQLMILTSRSEVEMTHLLDPQHHLAGRISSFYHKGNMRYHKPDHRAFEVIERDHNLRPDECVYVGDSPSDASASNGAGIPFIASLESTLRTREDFADYRVDVFIDHFTELPDAVAYLESKL